MNTQIQSIERFSIPSILAVIAAVLSFLTGPLLGLIFAGVALVAGLLGLVLSISPSKRGGIMSAFAVLGGAIGVLAAIIKTVLWIL